MNPSIEPRRPGRPTGCLTSALSRWLRIEIQQAKRDNWTCPDAFFMLTEQNRKTPNKHAFIVGAETADEMWLQICGDIKGKKVSYDNFRKLWRQTQ